MNKIPLKSILAVFVCLLIYSCHSSSSANADAAKEEVRTPVTVTSVSMVPLNEYIELNATSVFLQQNFVKSNLNGYIQQSNIKYGDYAHRGQVLFVLKTKEARAIGNAVNQLDSSFDFSGVNVIRSGASGYVMQLNHQAGDYVQDGEELAAISDSKSFMFVMNVPYEDNPYVSVGKHVQVILPDNEKLNGIISSSMPMVDSVTQTQSYAIKVNAPNTIPQNLIAKVKIVKVSKAVTATLPKNAVLSNQTLSEYWVMKMINDTTAVKVPVKKGIETADKVEILSPAFLPQDKILLSGNYGLPDTAFVIASPAATTAVQ